MLSRRTARRTAWIDLFAPSADELRAVLDECDIPLAFRDDLSSPAGRAGAALADSTLKVTLDFPVVKLMEKEHPQEIKFFVTKRALITVRYGDIAALHQFSKEFEVVTALDKTKKALHGGQVFAALLTALYTALEQKLDYISDRLGDIEEEVFKEREREMVAEISHVSRRLIRFGQTIAPHSHVLSEARAHCHTLFGDPADHALADLEGRLRHISRYLVTLSETAAELRETNNTLLNTKQNEIMKTLTVMTSTLLPLTLLASLFGMNVALPIGNLPGDFWAIIAAMAVIAISLSLFFRKKRWM